MAAPESVDRPSLSGWRHEAPSVPAREIAAGRGGCPAGWVADYGRNFCGCVLVRVSLRTLWRARRAREVANDPPLIRSRVLPIELPADGLRALLLTDTILLVARGTRVRRVGQRRWG